MFCVGQNYVGHIEEMGYDLPEFPSIFMRTHASFAPHGADIIKPDASEQFDYEAELTAVIGRPARHVTEADTLDYIAGYTIMNEGSVRDWQRRGPQVTPGKNFDRSGTIGPCIATTDDIPDPAALTMETRVNGEVRQRTRTDDMVFSIPYLISYISTFCELQPVRLDGRLHAAEIAGFRRCGGNENRSNRPVAKYCGVGIAGIKKGG